MKFTSEMQNTEFENSECQNSQHELFSMHSKRFRNFTKELFIEYFQIKPFPKQNSLVEYSLLIESKYGILFIVDLFSKLMLDYSHLISCLGIVN